MSSKVKSKTNLTLDQKLEKWLSEKHKMLFYILLGVFVLFSFLYFNARVSIMGDDSTYISKAMNFIRSGTFPTYQGPLYPMVLSLFVGLFGMNLVAVKLSSFIFMLVFFVLFYKTLVGKVSYLALFFSLTIISISNYFLFFTCQTFSEAFFMALQAVLFLLVYKDVALDSNDLNKSTIKAMVLIGFIGFLLFITRTIGFGAVLAVFVYDLIHKNYKKSGVVLAAFLLFLAGFLVLKSAIWDIPLEMGDQSSQLMSKNPYDSSQGKEDFSGFIQRFQDNSNLYLSMHFMRIVGFKSPIKNTTNTLVTLLLYAVFIYGAFSFYKKNKFLFFIAIYLAVMLGITFFSLQKIWSQYRLIIPFVPYMLVFLVASILSFASIKKVKIVQFGFPVILMLSVVLTFSTGFKSIDLPTLQSNLEGDKLAGFTPDWVSYLQAVDFSSKKLGEDSYVACRKPNIARIYAKGKKYYGIYRIPSNDADELLDLLKEKKVTHIILASLRKNPRMYTGQTINTIQRYMSVINKKFPKTFKLIKKYGDKEPAYVFEIDYSKIIENKE